MKNILIHGLGQNHAGWNEVETELNSRRIEVEKPDLYSMIKEEKTDYDALFQGFAQYCNSLDGKLNLCGLSLGGILALDYAKEFPGKINSLILIGTPYKVPKFLFKIQEIIFYFMPQSIFEKIGCLKKDFISLVNSMRDLRISHNLDKISCKTLILCGVKDRQNMNCAKLLNQHIKGSVFKTVEKASHEVNRDNPQGLSDILFDFWTKADGRES